MLDCFTGGILEGLQSEFHRPPKPPPLPPPPPPPPPPPLILLPTPLLSVFVLYYVVEASTKQGVNPRTRWENTFPCGYFSFSRHAFQVRKRGM